MRTGRFGGRQLGPARKARHRDATILRQWSTDRTYCLVRADTIADCSKTWHKPPGAIKARVPLAGDQGGDSYRFRSGGQCGSWRWPGPHSPSSKMGSCGQDRPAASVGLSPPFETRVATAVSIFRGRSAGRSERPHPVADPRKVTVAPRGFRHRHRTDADAKRHCVAVCRHLSQCAPVPAGRTSPHVRARFILPAYAAPAGCSNDATEPV